MTHIRIYKELRKAIAGCLAVMLLPLLTACEHKDLCYDHSHTTQFGRWCSTGRKLPTPTLPR